MTRLRIADSLKQFYLVHKQKIILICELILVLLFAAIEWHFKHRFYSIFIIGVFFLALPLQKKRYLDFIIPIIFLFIIFNTLTVDCLLLFRRIDVPSIQHPKTSLVNLFEPNTGLEVLPTSVQVMLSMLNTTKIENYKLAPDFYNNGEIMQRIVEAAWPIKLEDASPFIFIPGKDTDQYQDCSLIMNVEDISLVDCR